MTISKTDSKPYGTEFFLSTPDSGEESIVNWNSLGRIIDFNLNITTPTPNTIFENEKGIQITILDKDSANYSFNDIKCPIGTSPVNNYTLNVLNR